MTNRKKLASCSVAAVVRHSLMRRRFFCQISNSQRAAILLIISFYPQHENHSNTLFFL
jgi:hypothetical protein